MRKMMSLAVVLSMAAMPMLAGCDRTVSDKESVQVKDNGTTVRKQDKVTEKSDGTVVKEESKSVSH
jgi:Ni/Co efflux regulator RcnB